VGYIRYPSIKLTPITRDTNTYDTLTVAKDGKTPTDAELTSPDLRTHTHALRASHNGCKTPWQTALYG
jgi:hypothetical protein